MRGDGRRPRHRRNLPLGGLPLPLIRFLGVALKLAVDQRHRESLAGRRDLDSSFQDGVVLVARAIQEHVRRSFLQAGESLLRAESPIVL